MDELARIAYESAIRALDKQERVLEELRARTAVLLAGSSLAVSLLGRSAFERPHPLMLLIVALCAFGASIGASVFVFLPRPSFVFAINGPAVYEGLYDSETTHMKSADVLPTRFARSTTRTRAAFDRSSSESGSRRCHSPQRSSPSH